MHRARAQFRGAQRGLDDRYSRIVDGAAGFRQQRRRYIQGVADFQGNDRSPFHRRGPDLQHGIADLYTASFDEFAIFPKAQHLSGHDGLNDRRGDFGMAADEQDIERLERLAHILEHAGDVGFGRPDRQQEHSQEPSRPHAEHRDVIGVDQHGMAADLASRQGNRIGRRDQRAATDTDHAGILPNRRRQQQFRGIPAERRQ